MKAIIIAAGTGSRLRPLTDRLPKCQLPIRGRPLLDHQLEVLRAAGIRDIAIIQGHLRETFNVPDARCYVNAIPHENGILESLFCAEPELSGDVLVSYSDILYDKAVVETLLAAPGDVRVVVDRGWERAYEGREMHPISEAEKAVCRGDRVVRIGKHLDADEATGEFIGMARFSPAGSQLVCDTYHDVLARGRETRFQQARHLRLAYLTDLFQELVDRGEEVGAAFIDGGWSEIDTIEDYARVGGDLAGEVSR